MAVAVCLISLNSEPENVNIDNDNHLTWFYLTYRYPVESMQIPQLRLSKTYYRPIAVSPLRLPNNFLLAFLHGILYVFTHFAYQSRTVASPG